MHQPISPLNRSNPSFVFLLLSVAAVHPQTAGPGESSAPGHHLTAQSPTQKDVCVGGARLSCPQL